MLRILRAFAWMRWRVLINSFERTGARDTLERLSIATEQLGPIIAAVLMIPSLLLVSALSGYAGYSIATGTTPPLVATMLRLLLLAASVLCIVGPLVMPVMEKANAVRLLLLPIPERILYLTQAAGTVGDPWVTFVLPVVLFLPVGMAVAGAFSAGAVSLAGGVAFALVLIGLSMLTSSVTQLIVRDRRRGELIALLFILVIPVASMLTGMLDNGRHRGSRQRAAETRVEERVSPAPVRFAKRAFVAAPSELYVTALRQGAVRPVAALAPVTGILLTALLIHSLGLLVFTRLLDSPETSGGKRTSGPSKRWGLLVPGLSPAASAVAFAHMRLALRTPRGRSILLSPLVVFLTLSVMLLRRGGETLELGALTINGGASLATFGMFVSLMSILPLALNQFAVDGAGLTMEFLSPISDAELLAGKAVANAGIAAVPAFFSLVVSYVLFPGGAWTTWVSVPLGVISIYLWSAPAAAAVSALLPRTVDLNSIGRGSNAHGAAGLLGLVSFAVCGLPALGLATLPGAIFQRPALGPLLLLVWCALAYTGCRLLLIPVRSLLARRRENLTFVV